MASLDVTGDLLLHDLVAPIRNMIGDIPHTCGRGYDIRFLEANGRVFNHAPGLDMYEAVLAAYCSAATTCHDHNTTYQYVRIAFSGNALYQYGNPVRMIGEEVKRAAYKLKSQMELLLGGQIKVFNGVIYGPGELDPETHAGIAEFLTLELAKRPLDVDTLVKEEGFLPHHVEEVATKLGFFTTDGRLALPPEHPLAA